MNDDQQVINLEHVLPENPEDNWPQFPPEIASAFYKRLGNLALLQAKKNSDLRSSNFEEKKKVYASTPYEFTRQIAEFKTWTPDSIAQRQAVMAVRAVNTWPVKV